LRPEWLLRLSDIAYARIRGRPLALSDASDLDGMVSAALFKMRYPLGVVVFAAPVDVNRSRLLRSVEWLFVADLPCPGKAVLRADHHRTNPPCAKTEFYDPQAPAAAVLALRALGLEGDEKAETLVKWAVETDTANITSPEAMFLNDAVKGAGYRGKQYIASTLASLELGKALADQRLKEYAARFQEVRRRTEEWAERLPAGERSIVVFERDLGLTYRYLAILLERRGASLTAILVPRGLSTVRLYLGADAARYDVSVVASRLGGGGHAYASGALLRGLPRRRAVLKALKALAEYLGESSLEVTLVTGSGEVRQALYVGEGGVLRPLPAPGAGPPCAEKRL